MEHAFCYGNSSPYRDKPQKNAVFIGPIIGMHQLSGTTVVATPELQRKHWNQWKSFREAVNFLR
jgi:hypothetical protein